jgi:tRNA-uridine 2-sulfurtransferase
MYADFDKTIASLRARYDDPHVIVAISGGVDSAVTAMLLKQAGLKLTAIFMKNWNEPDEFGQCSWEEDVGDALDVCEKLDIPINTVDLSQSYWDGVFAEFLREYRLGRTPNPDILCNREVKFKAFMEHIDSLGGDLVATGHYAQIGTKPRKNQSDEEPGKFELLRGLDTNKDQSYFLYALGQPQLARSLFPIGGLDKGVVRNLAKQADLALHAKRDSTGICFIGERKFREFLSGYISIKPGPIKTLDDRIIGEHDGAALYTIGQREGLGIGGVKGYPQGPWFVTSKNAETNELYVTQGHSHAALMSDALIADTVHWISGEQPLSPFSCTAQTRYRQKDEDCDVFLRSDDTIEVKFRRPQRAVTPGQSVVLYNGPICLGGAIIDSTSKKAS